MGPSRPRSRSPPPHISNQPHSPPRNSHRTHSTTHREDSHRASYRASDRYPGERPERDYEGTTSSRPSHRPRSRSRSPRRDPTSHRDRDRSDRTHDRDRDSRAHRPSSTRHAEPISAGKEFRGEVRTDGTWEGRRASGVEVRTRSPGRPSAALPSQDAAFGKPEGEGAGGGDGPRKVEVVEPNYKPSGALAAETNTLRGVVLKYNEPPEARKPTKSWRIYVFKGKEQVDMFHVHRQSAYLFGRDRIVADIPVDHPSTSKQHAVLQFRQVTERNEFGDTKSLTKPFVIDLDSANGTTVNDDAVPASRYYELKSGDVVKFAFSTREYVLITE